MPSKIVSASSLFQPCISPVATLHKRKKLSSLVPTAVTCSVAFGERPKRARLHEDILAAGASVFTSSTFASDVHEVTLVPFCMLDRSSLGYP